MKTEQEVERTVEIRCHLFHEDGEMRLITVPSEDRRQHLLAAGWKDVPQVGWVCADPRH